jgi:membrane protease YdiL (CAAX protease family)
VTSQQPRVSPWWLVAPAVLFLLNFVGGAISGGSDQSNAVYQLSLIAQTAVFDLLLVVYVVFAAWRSGGPVLGTLALRRVPLWPAVRLVAVAAVGLTLFELAIDPLTGAGQKQGIAPTHAPHGRHQQIALAVSLVVLVVLAPIAEELMFRGLCFAAMGRYALPGSAALFALAHGLPVLLVPIFVAGLVLGWVRARSGSLYPGMAVHMTLNAVAIAAALATASTRLC